ncbi:MAG: hypothetical protein RLZZ398_404 [Verrucomicrobiota bacterium]|jgi:hypothetical protein
MKAAEFERIQRLSPFWGGEVENAVKCTEMGRITCVSRKIRVLFKDPRTSEFLPVPGGKGSHRKYEHPAQWFFTPVYFRISAATTSISSPHFPMIPHRKPQFSPETSAVSFGITQVRQ